MTLDWQLPAAATDAPATRKRSQNAGRACVYTALAMLAVGFTAVTPSRAGMPIAGDSAARDSAAGHSATGDSVEPHNVEPHSVKPHEAGTQGAPQDRLSRPVPRSSRVIRPAPHRTMPPPTADATAQLNHLEAIRHQTAPPPHGILNFLSTLFHQ